MVCGEEGNASQKGPGNPLCAPPRSGDLGKNVISLFNPLGGKGFFTEEVLSPGPISEKIGGEFVSPEGPSFPREPMGKIR